MSRCCQQYCKIFENATVYLGIPTSYSLPFGDMFWANLVDIVFATVSRSATLGKFTKRHCRVQSDPSS